MRAQNPNAMTEGRHYWDGSYVPGHTKYPTESFSVGIFRALLTRDGMRCKRGPVLYRVKGPVVKKEEVFARATEVCKLMDKYQWISKTKSEVIK